MAAFRIKHCIAWIAVLLVSLSVLLGAGFFESPNKEQLKNTLVLGFSWWGDRIRSEATSHAIKYYEVNHPDIQINAQFCPFSKYHNLLLNQAETNSLPDIVSIDFKWMNEVALLGPSVLDIRTYLSEIDTSDMDWDFIQEYGSRQDGSLVGIPAGMNGVGLLCNLDFLSRFNIKPSDSWDWEAIISLGEKVHAQDSSVHLLFFPKTHWLYFFRTVIKQFSGHDIVTANMSIDCTYDDVFHVFSLIQRLIDSHTIPPFSQGVLYEDLLAHSDPNWLNQLYGLVPVSSSTIMEIQQASSFPLGTIRYPIPSNAVDPGLYVAPTMLYAITTSSKNPLEAAKFINYLLNDPQAAMRLKNTRGVLLNTKLSKLLTETGLSSPLVQQMVEQALSGKSKNESNYSLGSEVSNLIWTYIHHVGFGELSVEEASNQFLKDLHLLFSND